MASHVRLSGRDYQGKKKTLAAVSKIKRGGVMARVIMLDRKNCFPLTKQEPIPRDDAHPCSTPRDQRCSGVLGFHRWQLTLLAALSNHRIQEGRVGDRGRCRSSDVFVTWLERILLPTRLPQVTPSSWITLSALPQSALAHQRLQPPLPTALLALTSHPSNSP